MDSSNSSVAILAAQVVASRPTGKLGQTGRTGKTGSTTPWHASGIGKWRGVAIVLGMQVFAPRALEAATPNKQITDGGITNAVEEALLFEKGVSPNDVDVSTDQGIVTLSGSVSNLLAKERAVDITESIRGVAGTIDKIAVTPVLRPDADIRKDIQAALRQDPATESYQIGVSVQKAVATLTGSVGSYPERRLAVRLAKGVRGLRDVRNDIALNYSLKRTDAEIAADIRDRLQWDVWVNGSAIDAQVSGGRVTLSGVVGNSQAKSRAFEDGWVNGVASVDDTGIQVSPLANNGARGKLKWAVRSDADVKRATEASLRRDPLVAPFSPEVTVIGGEVILSGNVGNLNAKMSAERDARDIAGVWGIDSLLKVRPKGEFKDAEIKDQLKAALSREGLLDGAKIDVAVVDHVVDLSGIVGSVSERADAQEAASHTRGVRAVRNHLKVEPDFEVSYYGGSTHGFYPGPDYQALYSHDSSLPNLKLYLSDERIKGQIEKGLFWSPFVRPDDIKVAVVGGTATLTGNVENWIAWGEADKAARQSGATAVVNRVTVKRGAWLRQ